MAELNYLTQGQVQPYSQGTTDWCARGEWAIYLGLARVGPRLRGRSGLNQAADVEYASLFLAGRCGPPAAPKHHRMAFLLSGGQREGPPQ